MEKIKEIISQLQGTSSRNEKMRILEENKGNALWLEVLRFLLDPMVVTGIAAKKLSSYIPSVYDDGLYHGTGYQKGVARLPCESLSDVLNYLRVHNTGTLNDVGLVVCFARAFPQHREWLLQLFTKSLKLGVDASTANKVYGKDFIKVFTVMLAESFASYPNQLDGKSFIITQKLDGCRCVAFVHDNGSVQFFTRNGQDYGEVPDVAADLLKMGKRGVAYDGELIAASKSNDTGEIFRQTVSAANSKGVKTGLVYHVFDCLPIADFMDGYSKTECTFRKEDLHYLVANAGHLDWVEEVPILYEGKDQSKITEWSAYAQEHGWEGVMLNVADAPYQSKRVRDLLKVKKFKTVDVRVVGVFEGEGALVGTLGGVVCEFEVDGKTYQTKCGSGFTLEQRKKYWKDYCPKLLFHKGDIVSGFGESYVAESDIYETVEFVDLVGKIVELKCFEVSRDVNGSYSLRFPIWLDIIRFDKDDTSVV